MATPNGLNPTFDRIEFANNVKIFQSSTAYDDTTLKAEFGTAGTDYAAGSMCISTDSDTPGIWFLVTTTWTKLTVN